MIRVQKVRLYPNQTMKKVLDDLCDYRRYCWNQGLALWNDMYDSYLILGDKKLRPSERKVRNELVANKADWYGKEIVLASQFYPSTQRCSECGYIKTGEDKISLDGNQKHKTKHNEYICYECCAVMDRDENAVKNLLALIV